MLDNLEPAARINAPAGWRPGVEFDGTEGTATTAGLATAADFDEFLLQAGFDPAHYEVIGVPRTSKWQQREGGEWLTSYRFNFRIKGSQVDLPLLYSQVKKTKPAEVKTKTNPTCLVVLWSDLQVGKVDHRGGLEQMFERIEETKARLIAKVKETKPQKVIFCDVGDTIENFGNAADQAQLQSNSLSLMAQVDVATTVAWDILRDLSKLVPEITYASVGSNHCQWRINKQRVGTPVDDWGIHIGRTLARLSQEVGLGIKFVEPQPHDESLAIDVFGDEFHILGLWHGHQAARPDSVPDWWRKQAFGKQPVHAATIGVSGHFHHLRVQELGSTNRGTSRFWIQASTLDNGSGWFRLNSGEDSQPGLVTFMLEKEKDFLGTVWKL